MARHGAWALLALGVWSAAFVNIGRQLVTSSTSSSGSSPAWVRRSQVPRQLFGGGEKETPGGSIYDFKVKNIDGQEVSLSDYEGLTKSNYAELCELYQKYRSRGFEVLAFPCNQFGGQEPGTNTEVKAFAQAKCPDTFPLFAKIDVNGANEAPLYTFLKGKKGELLGKDIKWNFAKFLVDRQGQPVARFGPQQAPTSFEDEIVKLL